MFKKLLSLFIRKEKPLNQEGATISKLFHDASKVRPAYSCDVIFVSFTNKKGLTMWNKVPYSKKYDAFNAYDTDSNSSYAFAEAEKNFKYYWAYASDLEKQLEEL